MLLNEKKSLAIFGDCKEAEEFIYQNVEIINLVSFCVFDDKSYKEFHGIPVFDEIIIQGIENVFYLVMANDYINYISIKEKWEADGKREFYDFVWARIYKKKLVVVNANCHGDALIKYLNLSSKFQEEYFVYPIPQIQENYDKGLSEDLLSFTDVYIHQDIRKGNSISDELSDENVRKNLNDKVLDITIPNLVGMGNWMYPELGDLDKVIKNKNEVTYVLYRDEILDSAVINGKRGLQDYVHYWENYHYDINELKNILDMNKLKLKKREENWDIKIFNYIYNNYESVPCFVDANHPSKYVMKEIGRQLAYLLKLDDICDDDYESNMGIPIPILPCVKECFGLSFSVEREKVKTYLGKRVTKGEVEEYIKAYLWWYHNIIV